MSVKCDLDCFQLSCFSYFMPRRCTNSIAHALTTVGAHHALYVHIAKFGGIQWSSAAGRHLVHQCARLSLPGHSGGSLCLQSFQLGDCGTHVGAHEALLQ